MKKLFVNEKPELLKEWDYETNIDLNPHNFSCGSHKKVYWCCSKGHKWEASIKDRINGNDCPYCSNKKVIKGYNDLFTSKPYLKEEWDYKKNDLDPSNLTSGSNKKAWWICRKGHSFYRTIATKTKFNGCPYCSNNKVLKGYNDLESQSPKLAKEWNTSKNGIKPTEVLFGGGTTKWWWTCINGHDYKISIFDRKKGSDCPYCSNRKLYKGFNDLKTISPVISKEWDTKLNNREPDNVLAYSYNKYKWICYKGHSFSASPNARVKQKIGCPYCSNQKIKTGYNDLESNNKILSLQFDIDKNKITPNKVLYGGKTKWWWKCENNHSFKASIDLRKKSNAGCPYCSKRKLKKGFNDLMTLKPELALEWDKNKNGISSDEIIFSRNTVNHWWICNKGHSYKSSFHNRSDLGLGCPYCSNQKVLEGFNDVASDKEQIKYWNYEKNIGIDPKTINHHSIRKVWWKCEMGHEWKMSPYGKKGCPICNNEKKVSLPEKTIAYYCKHYFSDALFNYSPSWLGKKDFDIYIPSLKTAIEYDGGYYHKEINKDLEKDAICKNNDVIIYRIRDSKCPELLSSSICLKLSGENESDLEKAIIKLFNCLDITNPDISISRDMTNIHELTTTSKKQKSLGNLYPELLKYWDYQKNGTISPYMVSPRSNKKYWWILNHQSHQESTISITSKIIRLRKRNQEEDYYIGKKIDRTRIIRAGINDLESNDSKLTEEWDYSKNNLTPKQVYYGGHQKYWWICDKGHSYETQIGVRIRGSGCPYCSNKKLLKGFNDLETMNPKLAEDWNAVRNGISASRVLYGGSVKRYWKCKNCGYEWESSIINRKKGHKCPNCHQ